MSTLLHRSMASSHPPYVVKFSSEKYEPSFIGHEILKQTLNIKPYQNFISNTEMKHADICNHP